MSDVTGTEGLYGFALQEGVRALEHQQDERIRIRERSIATLGLAAGLTTFVVDAIIDSISDKDAEFWTFMALITAVFVMQFVLLLYLSRSSMRAGPLAGALVSLFGLPALDDWSAKSSATDLVTVVNEPGYTIAERYLHLATTYDAARRNNETILRFMRKALLILQLLSGLTVALLIISLWRLG